MSVAIKRIRSPHHLVISIIISLAAGAIGSIATLSKIDTWYYSLDKPLFNPPQWLFGPVWTTLYLLIGISLYLVWTARHEESKRMAFISFGVQLGLNTIWSLMFFGFEQPWAGFVVIILMLAAIIWNMREFARFNELTVYLMVPYLLWVTFAMYLNLGIVLLNP